MAQPDKQGLHAALLRPGPVAPASTHAVVGWIGVREACEACGLNDGDGPIKEAGGVLQALVQAYRVSSFAK